MQENKIAEFLQTLRKAKGYTQQDVANYLNISNKTISKWETGQTYPDILAIKALAELYDVSVDDILNGKILEKKELKENKARDEYIIQKTKKQFNMFSLIALGIYLLGLLLDFILIATNYNYIGTILLIFLLTIAIIINFLPYLINLNLTNIDLTKEKKININLVISIAISSIFFAFITTFIGGFYIIIPLILAILLTYLINLYLNKTTNNLLFIIKNLILILTASFLIFTLIFTLIFNLNYSFNDETIYLILIIFIISAIIGSFKITRFIFPTILSIIIGIIFINYISNNSIYLTYYKAYAILSFILGIVLLIIDLIYFIKIKKYQKPIIIILKRIILIINIIILTISFIFLIISIFYPVIRINNTSYSIYDNFSLYTIPIIFILSIITMFIPKIKYIAPSSLNILLGINILTSSILLINKYYNISDYTNKSYTAFYTYLAISIIIINIISTIINIILTISINKKAK